MEMEQGVISQTALDQLVCSEQSQMLKALIPYTSSQSQQFLALYAKLTELQNTLALFRGAQNDVQICSMKEKTDPLEMLEDIRQFSYGKSRQQNMAENRNEDWKKDPKLEDIDAAKLDMLQKLAEKGSGKSASDMLPFLMSAAASGKKNGLNFSQNEISAVLEVMKTGKSPQEIAKIDKIVNLMRMIR